MDAEGSEPVRPPDDPVTHVRHVEVQQIAEPITTQFQITHELRPVNGQNGLYRFDFDNHEFIDQEIDSIGVWNQQVVIQESKRNLFASAKRSLCQFMSETRLVSAFQKPRAKR